MADRDRKVEIYRKQLEAKASATFAHIDSSMRGIRLLANNYGLSDEEMLAIQQGALSAVAVITFLLLEGCRDTEEPKPNTNMMESFVGSGMDLDPSKCAGVIIDTGALAYSHCKTKLSKKK